MPYFRQDRKWKAETQTAGTTFSEALPAAGILDAILLTVRVQNSSAMYDRPKRMIHDHLTKIVVKADGVESFKDVWGPTLIAEWMLQYGRLPPGFIDEMSANYQTEVFPILFGRRFKDGEFGLDLSKFGETRLEITNDYASADLQSDTSIAFDIDLWFLENAVAPANFIGTSQISSHTWTGNSQEWTFKAPKKYKVRRILLGCESYPSDGTSAPSNKEFRNLRLLKYSYLTGTKIHFDDDLYRSDQDALWGFPDYCEVTKNLEPRVGYYVDTLIARPSVFKVTPSYSADPGSDYPCVVDQRMERWLAVRRMTAGIQGRMYAAGYGPLSHICLHEDKPDELAGYLDPSALADVEAKVGNSSSGGSSGTIRFITEHVRRNAP